MGTIGKERDYMKLKKEEKKRFQITDIAEKPLTIWDYVIFLLIAGVCFLTFQQGDLLHTAGSSYGYLNGHILDFYDYDASCGIHPSYMPSIYILFAVWNIPMKLFHMVPIPTDLLGFIPTMWAKILPCAMYLASGIVIYKICMEIGMGTKKSKICTYASLTMPIAVYAQFIFGQYDIFMLLCMLLGVYAYLRGRQGWFVFWFALSVTFKYSSLLIFLPLLLLVQKDPWKIIRSCIGVLIPYAVEFLLYYPSETFRSYAFGIGSAGDNPTGYIFNASIFTGFQVSGMDYVVYLAVLVFGVICAMAYFTNVTEKIDIAKWSFYLCSLSYFVLFGLCKWHPQWLLMAVPFWVIGAFMNRETRIFMVIDIIFMLLYTMFNVQMIPGNVDQGMLDNGIFKFFYEGKLGTELTMADLMGFLDPSMLLSMLTMIMLVYALFLHPKYARSNMQQGGDECMGWIRTRLIAGVAIFVIPAFICLAARFLPPNAAYEVRNYSAFQEELQDGSEITQVFRSEGTEVNKIQFSVIVNGQVNTETLEVTLREADTGSVLYQTQLDTDSWYDYQIISVNTGDITVTDGAYYEITYRLIDPSQDNRLNLISNYEETDPDTRVSAYINGEKQPFDLVMTVYQQ